MVEPGWRIMIIKQAGLLTVQFKAEELTKTKLS